MRTGREWLNARWELTPKRWSGLSAGRHAGRGKRAQNLVSAATLPMVWQRHIVDSAQLLAMFHVKHGTDQGAMARSGHGGGLSGSGDCGAAAGHEVLMVESRARRVEWLNRVIEELALPKQR
jgi:16S rRNA (guanine527-N7)-methyltransferase